MKVRLLGIPSESEVGTSVFFPITAKREQEGHKIVPGQIFWRGIGEYRFQSFSLLTVHAV